MNTFDRIQAELNKRNMSGNDLAKACNFSSGLFSQWRKGMQNPSSDKIILIADYLGVSVDYLLGRAESTLEPVALKASRSEWIQILERMSDDNLIKLRDYALLLLMSQDQDGQGDQGSPK